MSINPFPLQFTVLGALLLLGFGIIVYVGPELISKFLERRGLKHRHVHEEFKCDKELFCMEEEYDAFS